MKLINYEKLDKCVKAFEELYKKLELDLDEQKLILELLTDRRNQQISKMRTNDYLGGMGGGLLGSMFKKVNREVKP